MRWLRRLIARGPERPNLAEQQRLRDRAIQARHARNIARRAATTPLLDVATLEVVHDYYEFTATTDAEMDAWLHEQILRARKGRDLTPEERAAFISAEGGAVAPPLEPQQEDGP